MKAALLGIPIRIAGLLKDYEEDLEQAWARCGEEPLNISFSAKIGVAKGKNICEVSISFIKERIKDSKSFEWSKNQGKLFEAIEKVDKNLREKGMTMDIKAPGHEPVTLGAKEGSEDKNPFYDGEKKDIHETAS